LLLQTLGLAALHAGVICRRRQRRKAFFPFFTVKLLPAERETFSECADSGNKSAPVSAQLLAERIWAHKFSKYFLFLSSS